MTTTESLDAARARRRRRPRRPLARAGRLAPHPPTGRGPARSCSWRHRPRRREGWDELEDWIRLPLDPAELQARARALWVVGRGELVRPLVDEQGMCWVGDRWIDLSPSPGRDHVAARRAVRRGRAARPTSTPVSSAAGARAWRSPPGRRWSCGSGARLAELGLELHSVRDRGRTSSTGGTSRDGATRPSSRSDSA